MKVRNSLRSLKNQPGSQVVRRHGRVYVINKKNPRLKTRQGWTGEGDDRPSSLGGRCVSQHGCGVMHLASTRFTCMSLPIMPRLVVSTETAR